MPIRNKKAYAKAVARNKRKSGSTVRKYASTYRGYGDYSIKAPKARSKSSYGGYGAYLGAGLGSALGTMVAPGIGTALGAPIGGALGYIGDKIMGWGDYKIKSNTLALKSPAMFSGPETVRVRNREFICNISSSVGFTNQAFALNPGLRTTFPWLSAIAENFEQYRFNGLIAEFRSTSADSLNSTNTALGTLMMATDYDPADNPFVSKQQMLGNYFSNSGKPACDMMHAVECAPGATPMEWYYVRAQSVPSGKDNRLYDLATFQIATEGSQAAAVVGELWLNYDVTFSKRQMNNTLGLALPSDHFRFSTAVTTSAYFGTADLTAEVGSNLGCTVSGSTISFPPNLGGGTYLVNYTLNGTAAALTSLVFSTVNCSLPTLWRNGTLGSLSSNAVTSASYWSTFVVRISGQNASITLGTGVIPTSVTAGDLWITQLNGNINS